MTLRQMLGGGEACIYVNKNLKTTFRRDLKFNMLLVYVEIDIGTNKPNLMIGCVYVDIQNLTYLILQNNLKQL